MATAQADIHFSQFYETSTLRNPAMVGVFEGNYRVSVYDRNQWQTVANPYNTVLANIEYRIPVGKNSVDFLSFGLLGDFDKAGDLDQKITSFYPAINFNKSVSPRNNSYLSMGFTAGYVQYGFDPTKATFNNQFVGGTYSATNPTFETIPNPSRNLFDIGAGLNFNTGGGDSRKPTLMIGASGYHFTRPSFTYYHVNDRHENMRWNINAGMITDLSDQLAMQFHMNAGFQGPYSEVVAGGMLGWKRFATTPKDKFELYGGVFYRVQDAIIPVVKIKYKGMALGFSYDVNVSSLHSASNAQGGYEITLSNSGNYPRNRDYKNTVCPRF